MTLDRRILLRTLGLGAAVLPMPAVMRTASAQPSRTGLYTYEGPGTVNTHWIETPNGVVVIDVQRDLTHAREALAAVRAVGKPVRAVLVTHGHPDHYAGIGLFKAAWPEARVLSSRTTYETIRTDHYGFNKVAAQLAPGDFPDPVVLPDATFADDETLSIDGVGIVSRELGRAEANSATVFYVPATGDLYAGDLVMNRMHAFFYEEASLAMLTALDRLDGLFPNARTVHPGHGAPGPKGELLARHRDYVVAARRLGAASAAARGNTAEARNEVAGALRRAFPDYGRPAGQPDMVEISVNGLLNELAKPFQSPLR